MQVCTDEFPHPPAAQSPDPAAALPADPGLPGLVRELNTQATLEPPLELLLKGKLPSATTREVAFFMVAHQDARGALVASVQVFYTKHWHPFMIKRFAGVQEPEFFRRPAMAWEKDVFDNGHPRHLRYVDLDHLAQDEWRMLQGCEQALQIHAAFERAMGEALVRMQVQIEATNRREAFIAGSESGPSAKSAASVASVAPSASRDPRAPRQPRASEAVLQGLALMSQAAQRSERIQVDGADATDATDATEVVDAQGAGALSQRSRARGMHG